MAQLVTSLVTSPGPRFDLDSGQSSGPDAVSVTVTNRRQKFLFELLPGYHTQVTPPPNTLHPPPSTLLPPPWQ